MLIERSVGLWPQKGERLEKIAYAIVIIVLGLMAFAFVYKYALCDKETQEIVVTVEDKKCESTVEYNRTRERYETEKEYFIVVEGIELQVVEKIYRTTRIGSKVRVAKTDYFDKKGEIWDTDYRYIGGEN